MPLLVNVWILADAPIGCAVVIVEDCTVTVALALPSATLLSPSATCVLAVCCAVPVVPACGVCSSSVEPVPAPVPRPDWIVRLPPAVSVAVPARAPWVESVNDTGDALLDPSNCNEPKAQAPMLVPPLENPILPELPPVIA